MKVSLISTILISCSLAAAELNERDILLSFFDGAGGNQWKNNYGWLEGSLSSPDEPAVCSWYGISCNGGAPSDNGGITDIDLDFNYLNGNIYEKLWQLPSLVFVTMAGNSIKDAGFEGLQAAGQVQIIDLGTNSISDVKGLENAPVPLRILHLNSNNLYGTFPHEFFEIYNLRKLFLSYNSLTGTIPEKIGEFSNLIELHLVGNELTGEIPTKIGNMKRLEVLSLAENKLKGTIPEEIGDMLNLKQLRLHNNQQRKGGGHSGILPSMENLVYLNQVFLDGNSLTGSIPDNFLDYSKVLEDDIMISLSNNRLTGSVPTSLARFEYLYLNIVGNEIEVIPEELCNQKNWMNGKVEKYGCDAIACPIGTRSRKGRLEENSDSCETCDVPFPYLGSRLCPLDAKKGKRELLALTILYFNTGNSKWNNKLGWEDLDAFSGDDDNYYSVYYSTLYDYCEFYGVTCDSDSHVIEISLPDNGLYGEIPEEFLSNLRHLIKLNLSSNSISFPSSDGFTGIENCKKLKHLDVSNTDVQTFTGISKARKLDTLYINNVMLSSKPESLNMQELFQLQDLKFFSARSAGLKGNLTDDFQQLKNLESLILYGNNFEGFIPKSLHKCENLRVLDIAENSFQGQIPTEFGLLTALEELYIHQFSSDNYLTGNLPELDKLTKLNKIILNHNKIKGKIKGNFLSGISDKEKAVEIGLSHNKITGSIPESFKYFKNLKLDLVDNKISGIPEILCDADIYGQWMGGEMANLKSCDAILCPAGTYNAFGFASSKLSLSSCKACPSNKFMGASFCGDNFLDDRAIFETMFISTGGKYWKTSTNWDNDSASICMFHGVRCEDGDGKVTHLKLVNNGLSGSISSYIWQLQSLRELDLSDNAVDIDFAGIDSAINLKLLKLSNTNIVDINGIDKATANLNELHLSNNDLSGTIPSEFFSMPYLQVLNLDLNHFFGPLSPRFAQMINLRTFECFRCDLEGAIPNEIEKILLLETLNLEENMITGFIPTTMRSLKNLKTLKLGNQRNGAFLRGPLYDFKENVQLSYLDLSGNGFFGNIPVDFLKGIQQSRTEESIFIDLSSNLLAGTVPKELGTIKALTIYLSDNQIDTLPPSLCGTSSDLWMNGKIGQLRYEGEDPCDAIMCSPGTISNTGMYPCTPCKNDKSSLYGGKVCNNKGKMDERKILEGLYTALNGIDWIRQNNWMTKDPTCTWYGIECGEDDSPSHQHVVALRLSNNNLKSKKSMTISSLVFALPYLKLLAIDGNDVNFSFDTIAQARHLEILDLSGTGLKSLEGIEDAPAIKQLNVAHNSLHGTIPIELYKLTMLESLVLSFNKLTGSINGGKIAKLASLEEFYTTNNELTGKIPQEIGGLKKLTHLELGQNHLSSTVPNELGQLTNIISISLEKQSSQRALHGKLPSLANLKYLEEFNIQNNKVTGTIPDDFLLHTEMKDKVVDINLQYNRLNGVIPSNFQTFNQLNLYIIGNKFEKIPETFCENNDWMNGDVALYGCKAIACPSGTFSSTGRESNDVMCEKCGNIVESLFVGRTHCREFDNERGILEALYVKLKGESWYEQGNWMDSSKAICNWSGVLCRNGDESDDEGVTSLDLEFLGLVGVVPNSIFDLPYLESLNLKDNQVSLSFDKIGNAKHLEMLHLSGTEIDSLAGLSQGKSLVELHLTDTFLNGQLTEIYDLPQLRSLFIAFNSFSGTIPHKIGQLTNLEDFFAFGNDFSGSIPTDIGRLKRLVNFVVAENKISGQLPTEFGSLPNLSLLSLYRRSKSGPKLSGTLPSFSECPMLNDLYLDNNQIGGKIPKNFLFATNNPKAITLSNNLLTGKVPETLEAPMEAFTIRLEGNKIESLPNLFCDNDSWMGGLVKDYQCDAIMCKPGFASIYGFTNSSISKCAPCSNPYAAKYWGSKTCEVKMVEKHILEKLYDVCGGTSWIRQKNWKSDLNICQWEGIMCSSEMKVIEIDLVANMLTGKPPVEIFQLQYLQKLWLSENKINLSFEGIEKANELVDLQLRQTELQSLDGLSEASGLQMLDIRFNNLAGNFPEEVLTLHNLNTLLLSFNNFEGIIPNLFGSLRNLITLRLDNNKFDGPLPALDDLKNVRTIDFAKNRLTGSIPTSFLILVPTKAKISVDLSMNNLSGGIPSSLDRLKYFIIYLRGNRISELSESLCNSNNDYWMKGYVENFKCNAILCPPGTYHAFGRQTSINSPCKECVSSLYFGQESCLLDDFSASNTMAMDKPTLISVTLWVLFEMLFLLA